MKNLLLHLTNGLSENEYLLMLLASVDRSTSVFFLRSVSLVGILESRTLLPALVNVFLPVDEVAPRAYGSVIPDSPCYSWPLTLTWRGLASPDGLFEPRAIYAPNACLA